MANVIQHNISAMNTLRNLNSSNTKLGGSLQKLSSGFRINSGKDGPADLVISEKLRAQTIGLQRAVRNTQEAQNVIGIAEGALNEMNEILKTMRSLALHAANSGITAPEQVAADQSEVDSAIQTIDRIANTTRYSDQFLLNGNQSLLYERNTVTAGTNNNSILDVSASELQQIFKTDFKVDVTFNGTANPDSSWSVGDADVSKQAMKAYFEIDSASTDSIDVSTDGRLTRSQNFTLSGTKGSKQFSFDVGATMGQIASAIDSVADSTGVDANLIFASDQTFTHAEDGTSATILGGTGVRTVGSALISNNYNASDAAIIGTAASTFADNWALGWNTDGEGKVYIKVTGDDSYEIYKDKSLSAQSLIGHGTDADGTQSFAADNESGLSTFDIGSINAGNAGEVVTLNLFGIEGSQNDAAANATVDYTGSFSTAGAANTFDQDLSFASGVRLGENTDAEGKIYFKTVMDGATTGTVYAYNNARMSDEDLVAKTQDGISLGANQTIVLSEIRNSEDTEGTGLAMALSTVTAWSGSAGDEFTGTMSFNNLGVRVSSQDYGSDEYVRLQQDSGTIFQYYEQADSSSATLVDSSTGGVTVQQNGQDATLTVNGQRVQTDGLSLELSTQDVTASLTLNEGAIGSTTIAQVGYDVGSFATMAGALTYATIDDGAGNTFDTAADTITGLTDAATLSKTDLALVGGVMFNSGHTTLEQLSNFSGGMQYQLGEGSGDQERTVYSIESMAVANLGRVAFTDNFEDGSAVLEKRTLSLQDVLGGGLASLGNDPIKALEIIDQAIDDVSTLRARLGATQKNLLQTNANSLNVAIENITATESDIRDANMAQETTDFTKNQILVQAGTAMLAQANSLSQNVLQLLG